MKSQKTSHTWLSVAARVSETSSASVATTWPAASAPNEPVPTELKREGGGRAAARATASRFLAWGAVLGAALGAAQLAALPMLHLFAPSAEVRAAAVVPSVIGAFLQLINGVTFIGEGVMVLSLIHI